MMKDYATANQRLTNPLKRWVSEGAKDIMLTIITAISIYILFTQPGGLI